jgi:hypothetical protein
MSFGGEKIMGIPKICVQPKTQKTPVSPRKKQIKPPTKMKKDLLLNNEQTKYIFHGNKSNTI